MKKKYALIGFAAALVTVAIIGGSLAATTANGGAATNALAAHTLGVTIQQPGTAQIQVTGSDHVMPGDTLDNTSFTFQNTEDVPFYARVTVSKYWIDETQKKNSETMDANAIELATKSSGWLQADSVLEGNSGESEVYYYAQPLTAGQSAAMDLNIKLSKELENQYQGQKVQLDVQVDAVQYAKGENELNAEGILTAFGVEASLGADGSIRSVTQ